MMTVMKINPGRVQCLWGGCWAVITWIVTCFTFYHFSFQVPPFPRMPLCDPTQQQWVCYVQLFVSCVGGLSENIAGSGERLVKRKSCSPDSQTSVRLFSACVGVSAHCSSFLPAHSVNTRAKWRLEREAVWSWRTETEPRHFTSHIPF